MIALAIGFSLVGLAGPAAQWAAANNGPSKPTLASDSFWHADAVTYCLPACL